MWKNSDPLRKRRWRLSKKEIPVVKEGNGIRKRGQGQAVAAISSWERKDQQEISRHLHRARCISRTGVTHMGMGRAVF